MELLIAFLVLGFRYVNAATAPFCYNDPKCAPPTWPTTFPTCNGSEQSPINIETDKASRMEHLGPFSFLNYDDPQLLLNIEHTKKTIRVTTSSKMELSGGGLPGDYLTSQFHLHWGNSTASGGSEHWMDGRQANMELHIVHRRKGISLTDVFSQRNGLAVLGFLIQVESNIPEDPAWRNLTSYVRNLTQDGDKIEMNGTISLMDLISSVNLTKYYRYNGSLTTPECDEVVLWTVFEEPIRLSASLVESFFTDLVINATQGTLLLNTFRPVQENRNSVWASLGASKAAPDMAATPPPSTTRLPPSTTTQPPSTTTQPPSTTTQPPSTTTQPPSTTTQPPTTSTRGGGSPGSHLHPLGLVLPLASLILRL